MWHDLIHGLSNRNASATEPSATSVALEFHVRPTLAWSHARMIVAQRAGSDVPVPCTSSQISTPASLAARPHSASALPIRSEEHTSELQSLCVISYAVFCLKK